MICTMDIFFALITLFLYLLNYNNSMSRHSSFQIIITWGPLLGIRSPIKNILGLKITNILKTWFFKLVHS